MFFEALQISRKKAMVTPKKKCEMFKVYFHNIENSDMHIDFNITHSAEDKWMLTTEDVFKGKQVKKSMTIGIDALKSLLKIVNESFTLTKDENIRYHDEDSAALMEKNHRSVITKTYAGQTTKILTLLTHVLQQRDDEAVDKLEIYISKYGEGECKPCVAVRRWKGDKPSKISITLKGSMLKDFRVKAGYILSWIDSQVNSNKLKRAHCTEEQEEEVVQSKKRRKSDDEKEVAEAIKALIEIAEKGDTPSTDHVETSTQTDESMHVDDVDDEGVEVGQSTNDDDEGKSKKGKGARKLSIPIGLVKQKVRSLDERNEKVSDCIQEAYKVVLMKYIRLKGAEFCQKRCSPSNPHNNDCIEVNVFKFVTFHVSYANDNMLNEGREQFTSNMIGELKKSKKFNSLKLYDAHVHAILDSVYDGMTQRKGAVYNMKDASTFLLNVLLRMIYSLVESQ